MATTLGTLLLLIKGDTKDLKSKLSDADKSIISFAKNMTRMGNQLRSTGKQLTAELTLPLVGLAVAALKTAGNLEEFKAPLDAMRNSLRAAMADILRGALPALQGLAKTVQGVAQWFTGLSDGAKKTILVLVGIAAAIGPTLVVIGRLVTVVATVSRALVAAKVAALAFNATMVANPIFLVVAALTAMAGVVLLLRGRQQNLKKEMADVLALSKEQALIDRERGRQVIVDAMLAHNKALREAKTSYDQVTAASKLYSGAQNTLGAGANKLKSDIIDHDAAIKALADQLRRFDEETKGLNDRQVEGITITNEATTAIDERTEAVKRYSGALGEIAKKIDPLAKASSARAAAYQAEVDLSLEGQDAVGESTMSLGDKFEALGAIGTEVFSQLSDLAGLMLQSRLAALDNEMAARRAVIESSITDETLRAKALEDLDKEEATRRKEIQREQAKATKITSIFQTIIDTATAVVKMLGSGFPPFNFIQAAIIAAMGAAKTAFIAATPLPALAEGGSFMVPPGYPNDSFPMRVESGERVDVTPADKIRAAIVERPLVLQVDSMPIYRGLLRATRDHIGLVDGSAVV